MRNSVAVLTLIVIRGCGVYKKNYLFRGKCNGEWKVGSLAFDKGKHIIILPSNFNRYEVNYNTVGLWCEHIDKNNKWIFDGDIIRDKNGVIFTVDYNVRDCRWLVWYNEKPKQSEAFDKCFIDHHEPEIIGNKFDGITGKPTL
jgi:hypothetical protein